MYMYLDDVLVSGKMKTENLEVVPIRMETTGVKPKKQKCALLLEVEYLGFKISKDSLKPSPEKSEQ